MARRPALATGAFWVATAERAVKTVAQVEITFLGADVLNIFTVDWSRGLGIGLAAGLVSVLTSVASAPVGPEGTPSLVAERKE